MCRWLDEEAIRASAATGAAKSEQLVGAQRDFGR
jgi:hypothetical protein